MAKKKSHPVADQFGDDEMAQIKRYGQALGGQPTDFDKEVEKRLRVHEANHAKMRATQIGSIRLFVAEVPEVLESMGRAGLRQQNRVEAERTILTGSLYSAAHDFVGGVVSRATRSATTPHWRPKGRYPKYPRTGISKIWNR
jgi:hypothetical protein